ncbi:PRTRC system ThiF family protein [Deinococcus aquatilis]|uniref:PRTRC system ThiF family protein n=1 Tax=Deinococcus aquatilis TaxID=519440 RepID=UPI0003604008|nr:PRTRC system ThiF family protein [Deinococcus aquatilis]
MHQLTFDPRQVIRVFLIGVGGTGSLLLTHLLRLDQAIRALGGAGLHVTAFDDDQVSETNLTRQHFAPADVGRYKSIVLVERCNLYAGLSWAAWPRWVQASDFGSPVQVVITCVDSAQSRRAVHAAMLGRSVGYWLDCGNAARTGQVILGQLSGPVAQRLPHILERDPSMQVGEDDDAPSCSAAEALTRQHLFINPNVALQAAQLLGELLLHGQTATCGAFIHLSQGVRVVALPVPEGQVPARRGKAPKPLLVPAKIRARRPRRAKV